MNIKTVDTIMINNKSINKDGNLVRINLTHGSVEMNKKCLKVMIHYDFNFIIEAIENRMREMICTGTLNTGIIDLPCGFRMSNSAFTMDNNIHAWVSIKPPNTDNFSSLANIGLSCIGFKTYDIHTHEEIKDAAKKLFDIKMKITKHCAMGNFVFIKDEEIDQERCFDESNPDQLYKLFRGMQENFMWGDINNMIYVHSLFGEAYTNAVKRVSKYEDSQLAVVKIPESYIVYDEFKKILKKLYFNGFKIKRDLFICYIEDYLNINKAIEE